MRKSFNNKVLSAIFGALLIIWLISGFVNQDQKERNFRTDLVMLDTAAVSALELQAPDREAIRFEKTSQGWEVSQGDKVAEADHQAIKSLVQTLDDLRPRRLAARSKDKWERFEVNDSLGTRVQVFAGTDLLSDLYIGKYSLMQPPAQPGAMPMQPRAPQARSYVRLADEETVYAVDGYLSNTFNKSFNSWRNARFLKLDKNAIRELAFAYPADSSFTLKLEDDQWKMDAFVADSTKMVRYLNRLSRVTSRDFADDFSAEGKTPDFRLHIKGEDMQALEIHAYRDDDAYVLWNAARPGVYIRSGSDGIFSRIFKRKDELMPEENA